MPRFSSVNGGYTGYSTIDQSGSIYNAEFVGSTMLFLMATPPVGWVKDTVNYNNRAIRITAGVTNPSGTVSYTAAMSSYTATATVTTSNIGSAGSYTLSTANLPVHTHSYYSYSTEILESGGVASSAIASYTGCGATFQSAGGGGAHCHAGSSGTVLISSSLNMSVKYVDSIFATYGY
jgi:hypothetical protein